MTTKQSDGPAPAAGATEGDTLGTGGPHTHPVSAPHGFTPESGTPAFSKGRSGPRQERAGSDPSSGSRERWHGA